MELLEICSKELSEATRVFTVMYTIDGEILDSIDDIDEDT
jgi:hypothetical protein